MSSKLSELILKKALRFRKLGAQGWIAVIKLSRWKLPVNYGDFNFLISRILCQ